ncbi:hypothetical protein TNCV_122921 [Trichonephila clavipes]|nr:hypothetical protein TNCV_122921 [Trichonephila clavipes]
MVESVLKLSDATATRAKLCPSQYTCLLSAEVHEQMSRSDKSEVRPQCLSPQASLVLIYHPTAVELKG